MDFLQPRDRHIAHYASLTDSFIEISDQEVLATFGDPESTGGVR